MFRFGKTRSKDEAVGIELVLGCEVEEVLLSSTIGCQEPEDRRRNLFED